MMTALHLTEYGGRDSDSTAEHKNMALSLKKTAQIIIYPNYEDHSLLREFPAVPSEFTACFTDAEARQIPIWRPICPGL